MVAKERGITDFRELFKRDKYKIIIAEKVTVGATK